jgi:CBS domain-containing protein
VQRYLGLCLFSQAGVAIGLAILASVSFPAEIGNAVIMIVTATTFLVQIVGPPCVKLAVARAGEVGLNITTEDLLAEYTVGDVMDREPACFTESETFEQIIRTLSQTDAMVYPVLDADGRLLGMITVQDLKGGLGYTGLNRLLVAYDLMQPPVATVDKTTPLAEAVRRMEELDAEYLPVVADGETDEESAPKLLGLLPRRKIERRLSREVVRRRESAADREQSDILRQAIQKRRTQRTKGR